MHLRRSFLLSLLVVCQNVSAQPAVVEPFPPIVVGTGGTNITVAEHFFVPALNARGVRARTPFGSFVMELLETNAPITVTNFLSYVDDGSYENLLIHRSVPGFVIQTGGFIASIGSNGVPQVSTKPPVANEFNISNTRGTVAMARVGGQTNSATSQWFVNLADNGSLDSVDGGFTVFARVRGNGMSVVDRIAQLMVITNFDEPFNSLPLRDVKPGQRKLFQSNLVPIHDVTRLPFSARSSDPSAWSARLSTDNILSIVPGANAAKSATITVEATDLDGRIATASFVVKPAPARTYAGLVDSASARALVSLALSPSGAFSLTATATDASVLRSRGQIDRTGQSGLTATLQGVGSVTLRYVPSSDILNVVTSAGTYELRPAPWSAANLSPLSGKLANVLFSDGGDGYVQLRFDSLGSAKVSGRLADGSKFTGSLRAVLGTAIDTPLLPFLAAWKSGPSSFVSGNIIINNTAQTLAGSLSLKPRTAVSRNVSAAGAFWTAPSSSTLPFRLRFESGGAVAGLPSQPVGGSWTPPGKPAFAAGSTVKTFTLNPSSGLFSGKVGSVSFSGLFTGPLPSLGEGAYGGGVVGPVSGATSRVDLLSP